MKSEGAEGVEPAFLGGERGVAGDEMPILVGLFDLGEGVGEPAKMAGQFAGRDFLIGENECDLETSLNGLGEVVVFDGVEGVGNHGSGGRSPEDIARKKVQFHVGTRGRKGSEGRDRFRKAFGLIGKAHQDGEWVERLVAVAAEAHRSYFSSNF